MSYFFFKIPNGIVLAAGTTVKIKTIQIFTVVNNGWKEVEFYGLEEIELLNSLIWKSGEDKVFTI